VRQDGGMTSPPPAAWPTPYPPPPGYAPPRPLGGHLLASPWERLGAELRDHLVLLVPSLVVTAAFGAVLIGLFSATEGSIAPLTVLFLVALAVSPWTVGKRALGLRIVTLDGGVPDRRAYHRRFVAENASWLVLGVPVLGA
jgi:uncharacterized RDD family membrane protein YckC